MEQLIPLLSIAAELSIPQLIAVVGMFFIYSRLNDRNSNKMIDTKIVNKKLFGLKIRKKIKYELDICNSILVFKASEYLSRVDDVCPTCSVSKAKDIQMREFRNALREALREDISDEIMEYVWYNTYHEMSFEQFEDYLNKKAGDLIKLLSNKLLLHIGEFPSLKEVVSPLSENDFWPLCEAKETLRRIINRSIQLETETDRDI